MISKITDHVARALSRTPSQFSGSPVWRSLLSVFVRPAQAIEDAAWQLLVEQYVTNATGASLDAIGDIVKQPRNGLADEDYRRYILTRILVNRSTGTVRDLIRITRAALAAGATFRVWVDQQGIASVVVRVVEYVVPDDAAEALLKFLRPAAKAGVRVVLETLEDTEAESFTFATAAFASAALTASDTTIPVYSTAGFPTSGSLDIDLALAVEEVVTYTGISATAFLGVSPLASSHVQNCAVQLNGAPGKGFGDDADPAVGGKFVTARDGGV